LFGWNIINNSAKYYFKNLHAAIAASGNSGVNGWTRRIGDVGANASAPPKSQSKGMTPRAKAALKETDL